MAYDGWNLLGALVVLLGGEMDFNSVDALEMGLETGLTLVLVNLNNAGEQGR